MLHRKTFLRTMSTITSTERFYSILRKLKDSLRNNSSKNHLTDLPLLLVHQSSNINTKETINLFGRLSRKVDLVI